MSETAAPDSEMPPVWEGDKDFGTGVRHYRCLDISKQIGQSNFEYLNPKSGWRPVTNVNVKRTFHKFMSQMPGAPF